MNISIIGGGSWGLAISKLLTDNGHNVTIWEFNPKYVDMINEYKENSDFLPGITIKAKVTNSLNDSINNMTDFIVLATPSSFLENTLKNIAPILKKYTQIKGIINVAKGYNHKNGELITDLIKQSLPKEFAYKICVLSGPSHAEEVAKGLPTTVTVAGTNLELLEQIQAAFSNDYFRVYSSFDLIGVELGGAIKNVIALAAGIVSGLGLGDNTLGALLTRGNVEIKRLAQALGAKAETLDGLSGIGDLITTAISPHSRNRFVGFELGKGRKLNDIIDNMKMIAEGVPATYTTRKLAHKLHIEMPIVEATYLVLEDKMSPQEAITKLMNRNLKSE